MGQYGYKIKVLELEPKANCRKLGRLYYVFWYRGCSIGKTAAQAWRAAYRNLKR